jgi:hypothetical protein
MGTALRWLGDDTEYGLYFMNYHSRTPTVGTVTAGASTLASIPGIVPRPADRARQWLGSRAKCDARARSVLPRLPGRHSPVRREFSTTLSTGTAWTGEISYRPNAPVQVNTNDLTLAMLNPIAGGAASPIASRPGADNKGYRRKEITQVQSTLTHFFDQVMGADRLTLVGEAAVVHVGGLEARSKLRYGRDSVYGQYGFGGDTDGFVTSTSWGYRARAILDYNNLIAGINIKPNLSWSHDVRVWPQRAVQRRCQGHQPRRRRGLPQHLHRKPQLHRLLRGDYNTLEDRDFVALSFGVNF